MGNLHSASSSSASVEQPPLPSAMTDDMCAAYREYGIVDNQLSNNAIREQFRGVELLPEEHRKGLGYMYLPIVISGPVAIVDRFLRDASLVVKKSMYDRKENPSVAALTAKEIVAAICAQMLRMDHPAFYNGLKITERIVNPRDIQREVDSLSVCSEHTSDQRIVVWGFMAAFQRLELKVDDLDTLHLCQENCSPPSTLNLPSWEMALTIHVKSKHAPCFNHVLYLTLAPIEPDSSDSESD